MIPSRYRPNLGPREEVYCLADHGVEARILIAPHSGVKRFDASEQGLRVREALEPAVVGMGVLPSPGGSEQV